MQNSPLPLAYGALRHTTIVIAPSGAGFSRLLLLWTPTGVHRMSPVTVSGRVVSNAEGVRRRSELRLAVQKRASRNFGLARHSTAPCFPQADFWPVSGYMPAFTARRSPRSKTTRCAWLTLVSHIRKGQGLRNPTLRDAQTVLSHSTIFLLWLRSMRPITVADPTRTQ